jgi:hypothetical protein
MRSHRDRPRRRVRFARSRIAGHNAGTPQPPSLMASLSAHADTHAARTIAARRSRQPATSATASASTRWLEGSTVRADAGAYRRGRGWFASRIHPSSDSPTASEETDRCARRAGGQLPRGDVCVVTERRARRAGCVRAIRVALETMGRNAVSPLTAAAGTGFGVPGRPPKQRSGAAIPPDHSRSPNRAAVAVRADRRSAE